MPPDVSASDKAAVAILTLRSMPIMVKPP